MIGITSFGGYIPRPRLSRMSIFENMGWFAPAIIQVAQGERSFCNFDEDSISMAVAAARDCLIGKDKMAVDGLYLSSTTLPFSDRLNAGIVKTALSLRDDVAAADFTSSLRAGTTALIQALAAVKGGDMRQILVAAADKRMTRAAYFYEMWFGDGAASLLVGDADVVAEFLGSYSVTHDFIDHYRGSERSFDYMWEERWVRDEGYAKIVPEAIAGLLRKLSITMNDVDRLVFPCFFKTEHRNIGKNLGAGPGKLLDNMHEVCGETGAAHSLVMLAYALEEAKPGDRILVAGFGQGCDALLFRVTDAIQNLPARRGIHGSLAHKKTTDNYLKFLRFRELLQTEMGIRAEAPKQTAISALWRNREMVLGLVGGKCVQCGTPQFPSLKVCVNPDCHAVDSQEPYEFADEPAVVKSFTADMLAVSLDPPAIYGMVEFQRGGRFLFDFTDCEFSDVKVGQPVVMSFRRRYHDDQRGFTGYFWKAVPVPVEPATVIEAVAGEPLRFDGRVAIVTGAGAGLGRAYALELVRRGAKVVVNDLGGARDGTGGGSASAADKVVEEIRSLGGEAVANYDSVASAEGGQSIVDMAMRAFGRVDILINNAGILRDKTLVNMEPENWDGVMDVHLKGAYNVTRPAFIRMREQGYGRIVVTTSAAGLYGNFGQTNYSSAKMGLVGFMNALKLEGGKHNIKVNTVAPIAATRLSEDVLPPELIPKLKPEFVVPLVMVLVSESSKGSGMIYNAGMGVFNRAAFLTGVGAAVGDGTRVPTVEEIHQNWAAINRLEGGRELPNVVASFEPMVEAFKPKKVEAEVKAEGGGGKLTVRAIFDRMVEAFQSDRAAGVDVVFQYVISGASGGSWYVAVKDGACEVTEGAHAKPTTTIKMGDEDFVKMISGELKAMAAFTSGRLKVEGDIMKSQLIEKLFKIRA
jgi:3-hydroxy-3-methylglutaryl CoA synthase/NAD(P)-dependent dehydrogenase (short-subunit alcohol dehydrogenase family)/putative sterol carrier protein